MAKVGGLGEVSAALPAALRELQMDARVLLPGYPGVLAAASDARELARLTPFDAPFEARLLMAHLPNGVPLIILECPRLYARAGGPYQNEAGEDWDDNGRRFGLLSKVAAILGSASSPLDWRPQIIHCNDWPAALAPAYLHYTPQPRAAAVMTVHNMAFQGNFEPDLVAVLGLPESSFAVDGLEFHGRMSFLKAGLLYADAITTVSPTYAREIQSEPLGFGMHGLLRLRRDSLFGILNGIDTAAWNPETDPLIAHRYSAATLDRKPLNKEVLQRRLRLVVEPEIPLIGVVSRFTQQKGIDVLVEAASRLVELPAQLVALGTGERELEDALRTVAARYPGNIAVAIGFDEGLAHLIEAGADMFLMPSRFEPCGLNQMYSQRYGTPPVARATGGLADTIVDCNSATLGNGSATGILFHQLTPAALLAAVRRAVAMYRDRRSWRVLQQNGMARYFGWDTAAKQYAGIYARLVSHV
jgi:starch synthase